MRSFPQFIGCLFISVLLTGSVCCGGEPPPQKDTRPPNLEFPRRPSVRESPRDRQTADQEQILERFKIATDGGMLLLPVEIQEKRYWFVVDTGLRTTVFDTSLRSLLGEPVKSTTIRAYDRDITIPIFSAPAVKVGRLSLAKNSEVRCRDLENMREGSGQEFHGILGMDFLRQYAFRLDFDRGELTFLRKVGQKAGEGVPIEFKDGLPCVGVKTRGFTGRGRFLVDTGCVGFASGCIMAEGFDSLAKRGFVTIVCRTHTANLWRSGEWRIGSVDVIDLGTFRHENLIFGELSGNILGLNYWSRYVVTFDFPNSVIYLKKGRRFDQADIYGDMSGLDIRRRKGEVVVISVASGSPAANAGIKRQDLLLKIDDTDVTKMSLIGSQRLLSMKGKQYRLLIRRGAKKMVMTIQR